MNVGFVGPARENMGFEGAPPWTMMRQWALDAERVGFDVYWVPDELVWEDSESGKADGWWECVALTGAIAATTERIGVGSWVLSALHRNPGLTAKIAATLDEISGGRFVFGFGAGHAGRQGEAFGFPSDATVSRYEESLAVVVPLLRNGSVTFSGEFHSAVDQPLRPSGPRDGDFPIMLAGHGPRNMRLAATFGDIWSGYATSSSQPEAFSEMLDRLEQACGEVGRDPATLTKSIGVFVAAPGHDPEGPFDDLNPIVGSERELVETFGQFAALGVDRLELMVLNDPTTAIPAFEDVIRQVAEL